jgi:hypothetical protein
VLPGLPSNEKNSSDYHNSYNKGPNLALFSFTESPSNSIPTIKFPKNHITFSYHRNMPKTKQQMPFLSTKELQGLKTKNIDQRMHNLLGVHFLGPLVKAGDLDCLWVALDIFSTFSICKCLQGIGSFFLGT